MKILVLAAVFFLFGCANVTHQIDAATGMTKEERCAQRRALIAGFDLLEQDGLLTEASRKERSAYQFYVTTVCLPVE